MESRTTIRPTENTDGNEQQVGVDREQNEHSTGESGENRERKLRNIRYLVNRRGRPRKTSADTNRENFLAEASELDSQADKPLDVPIDVESSFSKKPTKKEAEKLLSSAIAALFQIPEVFGHSHWKLNESETELLSNFTLIFINSLPKNSQKRVNEQLAKTVPMLGLVGVLIVVISPRVKTSLTLLKSRE